MARIANLAMMEFAIIRAFPFPHSTAAFALREKNGAATSFQSFCKYFAGAFYCRLCAWQDMFEAFRQGKNRSKSYFILGIRRKKFPNSNPKGKSAPTLYFSHSQTRPSNITQNKSATPLKKGVPFFGTPFLRTVSGSTATRKAKIRNGRNKAT